MGSPIYLDYNATTPIDPDVAREMMPYFSRLFGNPSSSYFIGLQNKQAIEKARKQVAESIHCKPEEIYFTSGGTESNNHAIKGVAFANKNKGKHIITSSIEHPAVIEVCKYLSSFGFETTYLPVDKYGSVNPKDVEKAIRKDTVLLSIMHANNEVGTIQPIEKIASIAKKRAVVFHTDAAQSVGKIITDVNALGVDMLSIAGHKLYAPKGVGALFIRQGTKIDKFIHGAGQEKGSRAGTENVPYIVALGKACEIAEKNIKKTSRHLYEMRKLLIDGLLFNLNEKVKINTDLDNSLPNTLSISFENIPAYTLASVISNDVLISTGSACHSGITDVSSVLKAMKVSVPLAASTVRISVGKYTSKEEIRFAIDIMSDAINEIAEKVNYSGSKKRNKNHCGFI